MKRITPEEQLALWLKGESVCPNTRGECCLDFSCCRPALLQPIEVREQFIASTERQRSRFLMSFLGALAASEGGGDVRLVGGEPEDRC